MIAHRLAEESFIRPIDFSAGEGRPLRVYHFLPAEFGLDDIEKRRIKVSEIDQLNDRSNYGAFPKGINECGRPCVPSRRRWAHGSECFASASGGTILSCGVITQTGTEGYVSASMSTGGV